MCYRETLHYTCGCSEVSEFHRKDRKFSCYGPGITEEIDAYMRCAEHDGMFSKDALGKRPFWKRTGELVRRRWPGE
jgi:hypothetical protein